MSVVLDICKWYGLYIPQVPRVTQSLTTLNNSTMRNVEYLPLPSLRSDKVAGYFKPGARRLLKIDMVRTSVCVRVCLCVRPLS